MFDIGAAYRGGLSSTQIAEQTGVTAPTVQRRLRALGVRLRGRHELWRRRLNQHSFDEHFFSVISDPVRAYWMGFLMAEGCIRGKVCSVGVVESDRELLDGLKKALCATSKIYMYAGKVSLTLSSLQLTNDLRSYGFAERKSLKEVYPSSLSLSLQMHFLRGYFDGDGCITASGEKGKFPLLSFFGGESFVTKVRDTFVSLGAPRTKISRAKHSPLCCSAGWISAGALFVGDFLYHDSQQALLRKKERYFELRREYLSLADERRFKTKMLPEETVKDILCV